MDLGGSVEIKVARSTRMLTFMRIRGEYRFWATTDRIRCRVPQSRYWDLLARSKRRFECAKRFLHNNEMIENFATKRFAVDDPSLDKT